MGTSGMAALLQGNAGGSVQHRVDLAPRFLRSQTRFDRQGKTGRPTFAALSKLMKKARIDNNDADDVHQGHTSPRLLLKAARHAVDRINIAHELSSVRGSKKDQRVANSTLWGLAERRGSTLAGQPTPIVHCCLGL